MNDPLDDLLDARLRDETPYIDDAGFTASVMKQLPRRRVSWSGQRSFIILAATILSVSWPISRRARGCSCTDAFARMSGLGPVQLLLVIFACGTAMTIAGLWAALTEGTTRSCSGKPAHDRSRFRIWRPLRPRTIRAPSLHRRQFVSRAPRRFRIFSPAGGIARI